MHSFTFYIHVENAMKKKVLKHTDAFYVNHPRVETLMEMNEFELNPTRFENERCMLVLKLFQIILIRGTLLIAFACI
jgi:hypothetical protein